MRPIVFAAPISLLLSSAFLTSSSAQPLDSTMALEQAQYETVTVYAPYVVKRQILNPMMSKTSSTGLELVSVSRSVSFADLNLSDERQVKMLEDRVGTAARDACAEIDKKFPRSRYTPVPANQDCVGNAKKSAMVAVKALEVAAAKY